MSDLKRTDLKNKPADDMDSKKAQPYYPIHEEAARRAKAANSFSDYRPGSATAEYQKCVDKAVQLAEQQKKRTDPIHHEKIDRLLDTYARKLAENLNRHYEISARVPSMMIAGPSDFPVRQKEKQDQALDTNLQEWQHIQGLLDKIRSTGMGGISADEQNAIQKLESKLEKLQQAQQIMKSVNTYYRKHHTLDGCPDLTEQQVENLKQSMSSSWRAAPKPFESFSLSNNNAEIRRVKEQIDTLTRQKKLDMLAGSLMAVKWKRMQRITDYKFSLKKKPVNRHGMN